jgi:hypothetical protein
LSSARVIELSLKVFALVVECDKSINVDFDVFLLGAGYNDVFVLADEPYIEHVGKYSTAMST